jgi:23S rRNA (uracil1939-C5)-methyltransferase
MAMPETYDLTLTTLTYGGDAMGRLPDSRAVFVPFGLPGEKVRLRLTEEKRGFARGEIVEILEASPERIQPKCKHFGQCGGCHYQHLSYESQLKYKADILRDQLTRIGKIENPPVQNMAASPGAWNYRNHVQFSLTPEGKIGFQAQNSNRVIPISECHLPEAPINELWPQLEFEPETGIGRVSIRSGMGDELMLVLESDSPDAPEIEIEAGISAAHVFDGRAVVMAGEDHITMKILNREFRVSAPSFFQVNTKMAEKMVQHLLDRFTNSQLPISPFTNSQSPISPFTNSQSPISPFTNSQLPISPFTNSQSPISQSTILDVYCGVGLFSAFLAPKSKRLIGIESSESACEDFVINLNEFENVELYEDFAENVLPTLDIQPDVVLVDPPRAGVEKAALDAIVKMNPKIITYVSCDPSTLARDAARLIQNGYKLSEVTPFDLFPQTYHIESISIFERQAALEA